MNGVERSIKMYRQLMACRFSELQKRGLVDQNISQAYDAYINASKEHEDAFKEYDKQPRNRQLEKRFMTTCDALVRAQDWFEDLADDARLQ